MADITGYRWRVWTDTAANLASENPILLDGEIAKESDTGKMKIGDGSTAWNSLRYVNGQAGSESITETVSVTIPLGYDTYRINIDTTSADVTLTVGDGQFDGQQMILKETGGGNVATISGSGIASVIAGGSENYIWDSTDSEWLIIGDTPIVAIEYSGITATITAGDSIIYDTKVIDTHNCYSSSTGIFTCKYKGYYSVTADVYVSSSGISGTIKSQVRRNGESLFLSRRWVTYEPTDRSQVVDTIYLNVGDEITFISTEDLVSSVSAPTLTIHRIGN